MLPGIDFSTIQFEQPEYLWLLVVPGALLIAWCWQAARRRRDVRNLRRHRTLPVRERFTLFGDLLFWLCLLLATTMVVFALSRPQATAAFIRTAGIDLVILQDGSASMHVKDVAPDRWQRSMKFLRTVAESLQWKDDRIALALFANIAAPQVRLTSDANTFFFFLDHLSRSSPFPLEDDTSWDTNIELGVYWGARLVEKDEELHGASPNGKVFLLVSDGQAWSGAIERSLRLARDKKIPVYVVGVGTSAGDFIPEAPPKDEPARAAQMSPIRAVLDRSSLLTIATAGGGQYYELDRGADDRQIASAVIDAGRRRAGSLGIKASFQDLYWQSLFTAGCLICLGVLFLRDRAELWLQTAGAAATLFIVWTLTR